MPSHTPATAPAHRPRQRVSFDTVEDLVAAIIDACEVGALQELGGDPYARLAAIHHGLANFGYQGAAAYIEQATHAQTPGFRAWARAHWPNDARWKEVEASA